MEEAKQRREKGEPKIRRPDISGIGGHCLSGSQGICENRGDRWRAAAGSPGGQRDEAPGPAG